MCGGQRTPSSVIPQESPVRTSRWPPLPRHQDPDYAVTPFFVFYVRPRDKLVSHVCAAITTNCVVSLILKITLNINFPIVG